MNKLLNIPFLSSQHGKDVDNLVIYVHLLMIVLFVGWLAYFGYTIWRFRSSKNPKADYVGSRTHASAYIEVAVAVVEGVLLLVFAVPLWAKSVDKFPDPKESTVMRVIGKQFNWLARYPGPDGLFGSNRIDLVKSDNVLGLDPKDPAGKDDILTGTDEMAVVVNKPVIAHITSLDVIHSFKVVPLRVTQDANPGMSIPIHFIPTVISTNQIQCSQLCGSGHSNMRGVFKVMSQAEFDTWLATKKKAAADATGFE